MYLQKSKNFNTAIFSDLFSNIEEHIKQGEEIGELSEKEGCILRINDDLDQNQNAYDQFFRKR